ncbi:MAG: pyrroline-5-carboxylate reductase [Candidatus Rhabdochlamydia sp.]
MKIAIIGCGIMGSMLARHLARHHEVFLYDRNLKKAEVLAQEIKAHFCSDFQRMMNEAETVILAFKPKDLLHFAKERGPLFLERHMMISILAGVSLEQLKECFPHPFLVRGMPNLPLTCQKGVMGLTAEAGIDEAMKANLQALFEEVSLTIWVAEEQLESLSVLTGSAPAFIFVLIEAMIDSGIALGFSLQESRKLVLKTLEGSLHMLQETHGVPCELKWKVTSPGGSTLAGLEVLESHGIRGILMQTYQATLKKVKALNP